MSLTADLNADTAQWFDVFVAHMIPADQREVVLRACQSAARWAVMRERLRDGMGHPPSVIEPSVPAARTIERLKRDVRFGGMDRGWCREYRPEMGIVQWTAHRHVGDRMVAAQVSLPLAHLLHGRLPGAIAAERVRQMRRELRRQRAKSPKRTFNPLRRAESPLCGALFVGDYPNPISAPHQRCELAHADQMGP